MPEELVPIFRVADARETAKWYARLGFVIEGEHRFAPEFPLYLFLRRGLNTLVYLYTNDVEEIAAEFNIEVEEQPWAREVQLTDPDGNRLRIGQLKN
jgi:catechol 2,3-dioxygenase-like lactoylglutathione lyase family enzyme